VNSWLRAVLRIVPPSWMMLLTLCDLNSTISLNTRPLYPRMIPFTVNPLKIALRVTARIAAFMPGASPPEVRMPIHLIPAILYFVFKTKPSKDTKKIQKTGAAQKGCRPVGRELFI